MALKCGTFVVTRACRTNPRVFKPCDVARVASYAAQEDNREQIIGLVGNRLGYPGLMSTVIDPEIIAQEAEAFYNQFKDSLPVPTLSTNVYANIVKLITVVGFALMKQVFILAMPAFYVWLVQRQAIFYIDNCGGRNG